MIALAKTLDDLRGFDRALVVENERVVFASNLAVEDAQEVARSADAAGLPCAVYDSAGTFWNIEALAEEFEPFRLEIEKPVVADGVLVLTNTAFSSWLEDQRLFEHWRVARLTRAFNTWSGSFTSWADDVYVVGREATKDPRELVREIGADGLVPRDVRTWLLNRPSDPLADDETSRVWASKSASFLMRALASEVVATSTTLHFRGPPRLQLVESRGDAADELGAPGFAALQAAAAWVYENQREAEVRHNLFSIELARVCGRREQSAVAFRDGSESAFENAKIAYHLSLSDLSTETLKALSELRKAVGDEVTKVSENARQTINAIGAAISIGLALIAARLSTDLNPLVLVGMAILTNMYVVMIFSSGVSYLNMQEALRSVWRDKVYRFLAEGDYEEIVNKPTRKAASFFYRSATGGMFISFIVLIIVVFSDKA